MRALEFIGLLWNEIVIRPLTNSLVLLDAILFGNFGLAIIVFTVIVRAATFPLTVRQARMTRRMSQLQPKLRELQKRHAGDRQKISQETMKLYRQQGVNPLGCLGPFALQMPIFIGMFYTIRNTLPTSPEALAGLGPKLYSQLPLVDGSIPVNASFLWLNLGLADPSPLVMPILVGLSTWVMTKMSTGVAQDPRQASMGRTMQWMMPLFLAFITFGFPSGLALYWIVSNIVGAVIQYFVSGWGGLFPSRQPVPATASLAPAAELAKETADYGQDGERGTDGQERGGGHRAGAKAARRRSRRGRGRRR